MVKDCRRSLKVGDEETSLCWGILTRLSPGKTSKDIAINASQRCLELITIVAKVGKLRNETAVSYIRLRNSPTGFVMGSEGRLPSLAFAPYAL